MNQYTTAGEDKFKEDLDAVMQQLREMTSYEE